MAFSHLHRTDSFGGYDEERFENEVNSKLLCPICLKVLKDPVQCPNEHYFCRSCIRKHLHENSETCPMCQDDLTEAALTRPPRFLMETLLGLKIRCNNASRGCRELVKLECLNNHVEKCGYSPTLCTNPGCEQEIYRRDKEQHESELCRFRMVVCDECGQEVLRNSSRVHVCFMRAEIDELAKKLNDVIKDTSKVKDDVKQIKLTQEDFIRSMSNEMKKMRAEMACLTKEATEKSDWFTGRLRVFVCGGCDNKYSHRSVELFSWPENSWKLDSEMRKVRVGSSTFVHEGQIFITGGHTGKELTDSIESLNVDKGHIEWIEMPVKMPIKCRGHKMICHENTAILTGGMDFDDHNAIISDGIREIQLNPPYDTKLLTQMPEPRCHHGCEIINNQVVIAGGQASNYYKDSKNTMFLYDINSNECKPMAPLPFAISGMATVSYKDNVVLIGGVNKESRTLDTVMMYELKTGKTKMLPNLKHKRARCAAVIIGNVILVMGGQVLETRTILDSVECLDLNTNERWRELSPMITKRADAAAVVKQIF